MSRGGRSVHAVVLQVFVAAVVFARDVDATFEAPSDGRCKYRQPFAPSVSSNNLQGSEADVPLAAAKSVRVAEIATLESAARIVSDSNFVIGGNGVPEGVGSIRRRRENHQEYHRSEDAAASTEIDRNDYRSERTMDSGLVAVKSPEEVAVTSYVFDLEMKPKNLNYIKEEGSKPRRLSSDVTFSGKTHQIYDHLENYVRRKRHAKHRVEPNENVKGNSFLADIGRERATDDFHPQDFVFGNQMDGPRGEPESFDRDSRSHDSSKSSDREEEKSTVIAPPISALQRTNHEEQRDEASPQIHPDFMSSMFPFPGPFEPFEEIIAMRRIRARNVKQKRRKSNTGRRNQSTRRNCCPRDCRQESLEFAMQIAELFMSRIFHEFERFINLALMLDATGNRQPNSDGHDSVQHQEEEQRPLEDLPVPTTTVTGDVDKTSVLLDERPATEEDLHQEPIVESNEANTTEVFTETETSTGTPPSNLLENDDPDQPSTARDFATTSEGEMFEPSTTTVAAPTETSTTEGATDDRTTMFPDATVELNNDSLHLDDSNPTARVENELELADETDGPECNGTRTRFIPAIFKVFDPKG